MAYLCVVNVRNVIVSRRVRVLCCVCAGALLPYAASPPAESALYHHGEEPGRAGYTVDDMFRLVRSAVQQQRVLGLQTLTNLLNKVLTPCPPNLPIKAVPRSPPVSACPAPSL